MTDYNILKCQITNAYKWQFPYIQMTDDKTWKKQMSKMWVADDKYQINRCTIYKWQITKVSKKWQAVSYDKTYKWHMTTS